MPEEIKINRPSQAAPRQPEYQSAPMASEVAAQSASKMPWVVLAVVIVVLIIVGALFREKLFGSAAKPGTAASQSSGYQAVFLTNGQVYFGKISDVDSDYVGLADIYYLQVGPQQGSATGAAPAATPPQQTISLVKLGNELHGPVDQMHISRSQILFYEDLKSDGSVVKAIQAYKANPTGAPSK